MMLKVTEKKLNFCEAIIVNNKQEGNSPPVFISLNSNYSLLFILQSSHARECDSFEHFE
jgi:hypothetical protein